MQQEAPVIHFLNQQLDGLLKKVSLHFLKAEYVCSISDASEVNLDNHEHYLPLDMGQSAKLYLEENDNISTANRLEFRINIQAWWISVYKGAVKRLPLNHKLLSNVQWLQPGLQLYSNLPHFIIAADCLSQVVSSVEEKSQLQEQFMDYCMATLPSSVKNIVEVDTYWHAVSQIRDISGSEYRYPTLTKLAKAILIIPHGNADTERLFSHLGLNKTKHRNCLGISTLNSLLIVQFNVPEKCFNFKPSKPLPKQCKNAISASQQHAE